MKLQSENVRRGNLDQFVSGMTGVASGKKVGVARLPNYRLYKLDGAGKISSAEWLDAADDAHAERHARELRLDAPCEVWDRKRLVVRINPSHR